MVCEHSVDDMVLFSCMYLQPRSLELLKFLGLLPEVSSRWIDIPMARVYKMPDGNEILNEFRMTPTLEPRPSTPYVGTSYFWADVKSHKSLD
jgi:hypothetical protein